MEQEIGSPNLKPAEFEKKLFLLLSGALVIGSAEAREMICYMQREDAGLLCRALLNAVEALQKQVDSLREKNGVLRTANANLRAEIGELRGARGKLRSVHRKAG